MIGNILRQRYRIIKQLGAGGFGETFLAEDLDIPVSPKPVCVVKKLHPTMIDPEIIRLFEQEAKILYQLGQNHDQIPKLSGYFQEDQDFYLIQEFIDGYDLTQEISPGKKLSEADVIQLLRDVLEILVYVHENNVIHRDIKPENIMRRKDGKLVLIDFGVVKKINTTIAIKSGFTSRTVGIGTHGYMPSEQAIGKPKLSSDIYALGMTLIQALTGIPPHLLPEDNDGEIFWNNRVKFSDNLEQIITKMVRYDWRQRYQNAQEVLDGLNHIFRVNQTLLAASKLVRVQLNGKCGYVSQGRLVIPCQFDDTGWFHEGLASVKKGEKYGYINTSGQIVIPCQFDYVYWFSEGLASVTKDQKWGYINTSGQIVIPCQFDSVHCFYEGFAKVKKGDKWGYINTIGQIVIPCQFSDAGSFTEAIASVKIGEKWGYINKIGQVVIPYQFDFADDFYKSFEGLAHVIKNGKWGYIKTSGQVVIPCQFDFAGEFSQGLARVQKDNTWGYINTRGQLVIPYKFDHAFSFSQEGLANVTRSRIWGYIKSKDEYINTRGQVVIPCQFDKSGSFSEGFAPVKKGDKWGYINTIGQVVIPYQFDDAMCFSEGLAKVTINGKDHLIDKTGKIVY